MVFSTIAGLVWGAFSMLALASITRAPSPAPQTLRAALRGDDLASLENLGLAVHEIGPTVSGHFLLMVNEQTQGQDLNGDGVLESSVCHAVGLASGKPAVLAPGTPIRLPAVAAFENLTVVHVLEAPGSDLNHDGDTVDLVRHLVDLETGAVLNLETISGVPFGRRGAAYLNLSERDEHRDLNGDGDQVDFIGMFLDLDTGVKQQIRTGLLTSLDEGWLLLRDQEWLRGSDSNGDGDLDDEFAFLVDPDTGDLEPLALLNTRNRSWFTVGSTIFTTPSERTLDLDLNEDGDRNDVVLHAFDLERRRSINLRVNSARLFQRFGSRLLAGLQEGVERRDLNKDGDLEDVVLHSYDPDHHSISALPLPASIGLRGLPGTDLVWHVLPEDTIILLDPLRGSETLVTAALASNTQFFGTLHAQVLTVGPRLAYLVSEALQGTDLNGDGDLEDSVLELFDTRTGRRHSTGLAVEKSPGEKGEWFLQSGPDYLIAGVTEAHQGGRDLNGDGDATDDVLHVISFPPGPRVRTVNLRLEARRGNFAVQPARRTDWIGLEIEKDLNPLGDPEEIEVNDEPFFHHVPSGRTYGIAMAAEIVALDDEGHALVRVLEAPVGDLNGDGDTLDAVLARVRFPGP